MGQIRKGAVSVTNSSTTVRHVWNGIFTSVSGGPFSAGEPLTWPGSGVGTAIRYDGGTKTLYFIRTAGALPAVGTVITGTTSGASATIAEQGEGDPPNFTTLIPVDQTAIFVVPGVASPYFVDTSGASASDNFELTAPWGGTTEDEASYGIQTAFTARGLPIIEAGDVGAAVLVSYGFALIEANAARYVHLRLSANITLGAGPTTLPWDVAAIDPDGWLQAGGGLKVPAGVSLVEITAAFRMNTGVADVWDFGLLINGTVFEGGPSSMGVYPSNSGGFYSGPIPVVEDDLITVSYTSTSAPELRGGLYDLTLLQLRVLA